MDIGISYRQGDILFVKVKEIPFKVVPVSSLIIAEGEATGHMHKIANGRFKHFKLAEDDDFIDSSDNLLLGYLKVYDDAEIVHDEHHPVHLSTGIYEIRRQRVFDPFNSRRSNYAID